MNLFTGNHIIELSDVEPVAEGYRAHGGDPWILLKPERVLARGWYRIDLVGKLASEMEPKVYFNFGAGFQERFTCPLHFYEGRYSAIVRAYKPTILLRFDPGETGGDFQIEKLSLTRLGNLSLALPRLKQIGAAAGETLRRPRKWRNILDSLRGGYLSPRGFVPLPPSLAGVHLWQQPYSRWIASHDYDPQKHRGKLHEKLAQLSVQPLISIVMPVYNTPFDLLDEAIGSVIGQIYQNWELCIADDCSPDKRVRRRLDEWRRRDSRIKVVYREENGHISEATNSAFTLASGDWVAMFDHDDLLREHALAEVALEIAAHPDVELIYSDEDKIDPKGKRYDPYFKPAFSRELFRSQNYLNHLTVHRADNIRAVGGWRAGYEGSQDYDLNLRIFERINPANIRHIPKVLYHWRAVAGSTAASGSEKSYAYETGFRALEDHVARMGLAASVEEAPDTPFYRLRLRPPEPAPMVSLIVPTRDRLELTRTCIESIREKTTYRNYEIIIIDNGSSEPETLAWFKTIRKEKNVRVLRYDRPFNYSAINNFGVRKAKGSIIGLINNDIEVISPDWLTEMVSWAAQPDIGCVGAKLYYGNDTIQHAGVILGLGSVAGHSHKHAQRPASGYFARLKVAQNLSAVTAACLLVRRAVYDEVEGLNAKDLKVAFNDVDFCLRVRDAGYANVFTPYAELYHHESISRGIEDSPEKIARFNREIAYMRERWGPELDSDPFYSPNLTRDRENFDIRI